MRHNRLCLIGCMGSGKSSLARRYGEKYGVKVVDTDNEFTRRYGPISDFFERYGEKRFRELEEQLMTELARSDAAVVATGGGAVLNRRGMFALRQECDVVWLTAPTEVLQKRIERSDRPLKRELYKVMEERRALYERFADYTIDTTDDSLKALELALSHPRLRRYDVVLCDADETLLDFSRACRHSLVNVLNALGCTVDTEYAVSTYIAVNDAQWRKLERGEINRSQLLELRVTKFAEQIGFDISPDRFNALYTAEMQKTRFTIDGAIDFCDSVRGAGAKLYIVTNGIAQMASERLKALDGHIDGYFISEELGYSKPDKRYFDVVLNSIGAPDPSRVIVFGDGETSDVKGGVNSGLDTCLFDSNGRLAGSPTAADFRVRGYDEFLQLL